MSEIGKKIAEEFTEPVFTTRTAIVTGGSRGIGKAIVEKLYRDRFSVIFTYNSNEAAANEMVEQIRSRQWSRADETPHVRWDVEAVKLDVTSHADVQTFMDRIVKDYGKIDVIVNNAGVTKDGLLMRMSEADWDLVIDTNLKGVYNVTKAAVRPMMSQKRGKIINITSVVALTGNPGQANYCASKAGVIGFTKSIAKEVASRGITVNAVAPGFIETDMTGKLNEAQKEALLGLIPLKRAGKPEDIANVVSFLASPAADYVTGQTLVVDGGMAM